MCLVHIFWVGVRICRARQLSPVIRKSFAQQDTPLVVILIVVVTDVMYHLMHNMMYNMMYNMMHNMMYNMMHNMMHKMVHASTTISFQFDWDREIGWDQEKGLSGKRFEWKKVQVEKYLVHIIFLSNNKNI